ncbi:acetate kinase [Ningiella sp. W23]|uniref:acetate kinase n=1 Tax=Ningiella sp. W23 TaxID=3023715 RepID=UPI003756F0F9
MNAKTGETLLKGLAENLFLPTASLSYSNESTNEQYPLASQSDHTQALDAITQLLDKHPMLKTSLIAVGHRVVHGGESFSESVLIDDLVIDAIDKTSLMAPLHNPANLAGITTAQRAFPHLPHVAVFDTAFFQTLPKHAYMYGLPKRLYKEHSIRKYGFHGTSHYFVSHRAAKLLGKAIETCNLITAHLGNGCSISAIKNGKAIDTSLGFTPLEGLVMGTRSGDIDPSLPSYLIEHLNYTASDVTTMLNKASGLLGISGVSNDCRELEAQAACGDANAQLALDVFCYRLVKYIGSYMAITGPLDALVFTGGIGENSALIRNQVIKQLAHMGLALSESANNTIRFGKSGAINHPNSLPIFAIATNEEWVIAKDAYELAGASD